MEILLMLAWLLGFIMVIASGGGIPGFVCGVAGAVILFAVTPKLAYRLFVKVVTTVMTDPQVVAKMAAGKRTESP